MDAGNLDQELLLSWVIAGTLYVLGLIALFLFCYWVIRLGVAHGMRSHTRWERSGDL